MTARERWQTAGRVVLALASVLAAFTVGWLLAQLVFGLLGRPPALVAYLVTAVFSLVVAGIASGVYARLSGRGERHLTAELSGALDRIAHGDFDIHLDNSRPSPFSEVVSSVNTMARDLGTLEQRRQEFVSNVSHEIQSPLTSISGFTDLLRDPGLDESTRQHYLGIIAAECRRLSGLSDNLLRLSWLDDATVDRRPVRLDDDLRAVVLTIEPQWSAKDIDVELDADPVVIEADADLLRQVWTNLIHNAVKFTANGGRVRIVVTSGADGTARVAVSDTGSGIAAADLPHVFERFYRADKARGAGGNGLGLALAKRIVDLHHGRLTVTSEPGRGTTFTAELPRLHRVDAAVTSS